MIQFASSSPRGSLLPLLVLCGFCLLTVAAAGAVTVQSPVQGQSLIAQNPLDAAAYLDFADYYTRVGQFAAAADVLEKGRNKADPSAALLVALGRAYEAQELMARAESVTREALVLDPRNVAAHQRMGEIYFRLGWPQSGLDSFREAVALAPDDPQPRLKLIGGLMEAGLVAEAEEMCLVCVSNCPEKPEFWLALGQVFEKQEKRREAFTTYGQVLTIDPQNATAYARQGRLFCEFGQFQAAESSCQRALDLDPDNALAHGYLGIACSYLGRKDEARRHAEIAEAAGLNMLAVWRKIGH